MKNTTPILVLTGLAIVAAAGIAGLTREQWMGKPVPAVATPEPVPAPAPAEKPAATAEATTAAPAETAASPTPAAPAEQATAAATPPSLPAEPTPVVQPPAPEQPQAEQPAAEPLKQPEQTAAVQPEAPAATETKPVQKPAPEVQLPTFDTVRVEKTGEAVIAGRAQPGSEVVVKLDGQEIGKTIANEDGAFVVVPDKPLPAGSGAITIEATGKGGMKAVTSKQSVAVIVPEGQQQAMVAIVSPDAPTKVLQKPEPPAEPPKTAEPAAAPAAEQPATEQKPAKLVSIDAVDYDAGGNIVFSGQGEKGNTARIYVDNRFLGDAPVGDDGRWTFSATSNISQGVHTLRVDGLDAKGSVVNRVEVPIFREDQTKVAAATPPAAPAQTSEAEQPAPAQPDAAESEAPATAAAPAAEQPPSDSSGQTTVAEQPAQTKEPAAATAPQKETTQQSQDTVAATAPATVSPAVPKDGRIVIQPGNNLWRISRVLYGDGKKFTMLYEANKDQIRNPNRIYPGQVFRTPEVAAKVNMIDPKRREPLKPEEAAVTAE
jgi:nucleoid-associated protein YgaU